MNRNNMSSAFRTLSAAVAVGAGLSLAAGSALAWPGYKAGGCATMTQERQDLSPALYRPGQDTGAGAGALVRTGGYGYGHKSAMSPRQNGADIVQVAAEAGSFNTLISAVKAAGLEHVLRAKGPYTVFAPTDEAFAKIPQDKLQALIADKEALTSVLTYHVVPGRLSAAQVMALDSAPTVQGQSVRIETSDGVKVDGASVVQADVMASNGIIHVIDTVILPN